MSFFRSDDKADGRPRGRVLPLLPLRDIIIFPHMVVPLFVGREKSIAGLEAAAAGDKTILRAAQKKAKTNDRPPRTCSGWGRSARSCRWSGCPTEP